MSWQDVKGHYQEQDSEPERKYIPADFKEGQRFMASASYGLWNVFDWVPAECPSCRGVGRILERDTGEPDRKCLDCTGTGMSDTLREPEEIASDLHESDARLLVFGGNLLAVAARLRECLTSTNTDSNVYEWIKEWVWPLAQETLTKMKEGQT